MKHAADERQAALTGCTPTEAEVDRLRARVRELEALIGRMRREHDIDAESMEVMRRDLAHEQAPHVCPGCHAVGEEPCAPGCIDAEIASDQSGEACRDCLAVDCVCPQSRDDLDAEGETP